MSCGSERDTRGDHSKDPKWNAYLPFLIKEKVNALKGNTALKYSFKYSFICKGKKSSKFGGHFTIIGRISNPINL